MAARGRSVALGWMAGVFALSVCAPQSAFASSTWNDYLDYAYVYVSAEPEALQKRLDEYAREAGLGLGDFIDERLTRAPAGEVGARRRAIAELLLFLAERDSAHLDRSVRAARDLDDRLGRHENRFWYHTVLAHRALHYGDPEAFSDEVFDLWFHVIVPLESIYETHQTLSLDRSARATFVTALPYLYENVTRLVLGRSQETGLRRGLDSLAAIVRFLDDGRVGAHPDVVPPALSSRAYLDRIVTRLDGPESDGGSLTFTLALFEAVEQHERARQRIAEGGLDRGAQEAIRLSIGAYEHALAQADTLQGEAAVYRRVLRQVGELYAAKQRLGVDPEIDIPFSIDRAMEVYGELDRDRAGDWERHGYRDHGRADYLAAMRGLWEEVQEASFNAAEYYLTLGSAGGPRAEQRLRDAVGHYSRYVAFFERFASGGIHEGVPDSAYFARFWATRGIGDAVLHTAAGNPTTTQVAHATGRYRDALSTFPFDAGLWGSLALGLESQGREDAYLSVAQPIAERVERSRAVEDWIRQRRDAADELNAFRMALSDDLALMYLGFANRESLPELERGLDELLEQRESLKTRRAGLEARLDQLSGERKATLGAAPGDASPEELPPVSAALPGEIAELSQRIAELDNAEARVEGQIAARSRALPRFKQVLEGAQDLGHALAVRRDHPVHALVRRMYFEAQPSKAEKE